jgi:hypothetical protein
MAAGLQPKAKQPLTPKKLSKERLNFFGAASNSLLASVRYSS